MTTNDKPNAGKCDHMGCAINAETGNSWGECTRCGGRVEFPSLPTPAKTLPEYPRREDYKPAPSDPDSDRADANYERARADFYESAALARDQALKVAEEALSVMAGYGDVFLRRWGRNPHEQVKDALSTIAHLPPLPR